MEIIKNDWVVNESDESYIEFKVNLTTIYEKYSENMEESNRNHYCVLTELSEKQFSPIEYDDIENIENMETEAYEPSNCEGIINSISITHILETI